MKRQQPIWIYAHSSPVHFDSVSSVVDAIQSRYGRGDFYRMDKQRPDALDDKWWVFSFYRLRPPSIGPFSICDANEQSSIVQLTHRRRWNDVLWAAFVSFVKLYHACLRSGRIFLECTEAGSLVDTDDHWIIFAYDLGQWVAGLSLKDTARAYNFPAERRTLFATALEIMGLERQIQIRSEPAPFVLVATRDLELSFPIAGLKGENPSGFRAKGLSFDGAYEAVQNMLASPLVQSVNDMSFHMDVPVAHYDALRADIGQLGVPWEIGFYGTYAAGVNPYAPAPGETLPLCMWHDRRDYNTVYQFDAVNRGNGTCLQISSNCGDLKKLIKVSEGATGLAFSATDAAE